MNHQIRDNIFADLNKGFVPAKINLDDCISSEEYIKELKQKEIDSNNLYKRHRKFRNWLRSYNPFLSSKYKQIKYRRAVRDLQKNSLILSEIMMVLEEQINTNQIDLKTVLHMYFAETKHIYMLMRIRHIYG